MRAVVQRVSSASVTVDRQVVGRIERGFVVLLGIRTDDTQDDLIYLAQKIIGLRVFEDAEGKMNLTVECNPLIGPQLMDVVKQLAAGQQLPKKIQAKESMYTMEQAAKELPNRKY